MWGLRKFGLDYCDLSTMLENISTFLRVLTLNVDSRNEKPIPLVFYIVTIVAAISHFYVYLVCVAWFVFVRCIETGDVLAALIVFSLGVCAQMGSFKLLYMLMYIDKVRHTVEQFLACDTLVPRGSRFDANMLVSLRAVKKRALLFWIIIIINGLVYAMAPLLHPGKHLMEDRFVIYGLEPMFETPNYEIAYVLCAVSVSFTCYNPANITVLIMILTGYAEAQLISLSQEMLHLWDDAEESFRYEQARILTIKVRDPNKRKWITKKINDKRKEINKDINRNLKRIIQMHALNIDLVHQVDEIYRSGIAIEFVLLIVALIAVLLGGLENTYLEMPFALMQVGMDCFTGQKLLDASDTFARAVYGCKWERFDNTNMKIVLMMMRTAQKGVKLSAGGFTVLSSASLMSVLRSVYSAYTTLRTTMK